MLAVLLVLGAIFSKVTGLPGFSGLTESLHSVPALLDESQPQCLCPNTRSVLDIIWSCLSTVFLCTWVAVHPNMPGKGEGGVMTFMRRLRLMFCAVIGPEMVFIFSLRQWIAARDVAKAYKEQGWTMTHAFFLIMGGFVLRKGDEDLGVISRELFAQLVEAGDIEFPSITREEIEDKSKGDAISKGLVILQTLWFTIQCIARGAQGLALTELELATLGFCSLNAAMYFMWWHKPLDVQCTAPIYLKARSDYVHRFELQRAEEIKDGDVASRHVAQALETEPVGDSALDPQTRSAHSLAFYAMSRQATRLFREISSKTTISDFLFRIKNKWRKDIQRRNILIVIPTWIVRALLYAILFPIISPSIMVMRFIGVVDDEKTRVRPGSSRVHSFYAPALEEDGLIIVFITCGATGIAFGGLHLVAWNFSFPTHIESNLWRYTALCITLMPPALLCAGYIIGETEDYIDDELVDHAEVKGAEKVRYWLYVLICGAGYLLGYIPVYFYSPMRMILLFEAFFLLRSLPPSALLDIDWQNFLPHF